jgi:hypothetical protein
MSAPGLQSGAGWLDGDAGSLWPSAHSHFHEA